MSRILADNGHETMVSDNCLTIEEKIKKYDPDIVMMDIWLPGFDGKKIIRRIKSADKENNLPVIIISAATDIAEVANAAGADAYLTKPFDLNNLLALVKKYETIKN